MARKIRSLPYELRVAVSHMNRSRRWIDSALNALERGDIGVYRRYIEQAHRFTRDAASAIEDYRKRKEVR